jgi:hypothetical protein
MRRKFNRFCHHVNGAVIIGLALLYVVSKPMPDIHLNAKIPDFLEEALWTSCRSEGVKRLKARLVGAGWAVH